MAQGNASKVFHPFLLPGDLKQSSEELRNKLMIDFDPLRCYVGDVEVNLIMDCLDLQLDRIFSFFLTFFCYL